MKKIIKLIIPLFIIGLILVACSDDSNNTNNEESEDAKKSDNSNEANNSDTNSIKVGMSLPLSGSMAVAGEMMKHGIELATEEYNEANELPNESQIDLVEFDDRATPSDGVTAANKMAGDDSISAVLGPYNSSVALAVKPIFTESEIPFLTVGTAADEMTEENVDWYFRPHTYNTAQSQKFARFITEELGREKIAMFYENTDYGQGLGSQVKEWLEELGTEVIIEETFNPGNTDFSSSLTKIKSKDPDAIVTIALGSEASVIAKQARDNGISGDKIIGVGQFDLPEFYDLSAGGAEGLYFMFWFASNNPLAPTAKDFSDRFEENYGTEPDSAAAQSYTAAKVLYEAMINCDCTDREGIRDSLEATDVSSPIGNIEFDENHNPDAGHFFAQWKNGKKDFIEFE